MFEKNQNMNKNIQEAKVIVNDIDGIFKYFDSLKNILPQIQASTENDGNDEEIDEMMGFLGFSYKRQKHFFQI